MAYFNKDELDEFRANSSSIPVSTPQVPQKKKGAGGILGFIEHNLPTIGAVGAGLAAAPFTGGLSILPTLGVLGAAGAAGSAAGELGKEATTEDSISPGKIVKEGVIGGVTSAIPFGGIAKGARAVLPGAEKAVASAAGSTATDVFRPTILSKLTGKAATSGRRLETRAAGIGIGEKMSGKSAITPQAQKDLLTTLKQEKIPTGHPEDQANVIADRLDQYHNMMDAALGQSNRQLTSEEVNNIASDYLKKIVSSPTRDKNLERYGMDFAENLTRNVNDVQGLNAFRRALDRDAISYIANPDAATAAKAGAAQTLRQHISENMGKLAPDLKNINSRYAKLSRANDYVVQQSGRLTRQSENAGGGIAGRLLTGDVAQGAKSKVGAGLQKFGNLPTNTLGGKMASTGVREGIKQSLGRSFLGGSEQPEATMETTPEDFSMGSTDTGLMNAPGDVGATQDVESPYPLQNLMADIQANPKQASTFMSLYKLLNPDTGMSASQKASMQKAGGAINALNQLESLYSEAGGGQGRASGIFSSLLGKAGVGNTESVNAFNQIRASLAAPIARAMGESGVLTDRDREVYANMLPSINDRPEEARRKLQAVQELFQGNISNISSLGGGSPDLQTLLDSMQPAQ